jgi:hypothetical protein
VLAYWIIARPTDLACAYDTRQVARCGLIIDPTTARTVTKKIAQGRRMDGFGNAGTVEVCHTLRLSVRSLLIILHVVGSE